MKKLFLCILLICTLCLSSCKSEGFNNLEHGKISNYIVGIYVEVIDKNDKTLEDDNPKIYFDFLKDYRITTKAGSNKAYSNFLDVSRQTNDNDIKGVFGYGTLQFLTDVSKVSLYPIYQKTDGSYLISSDFKEDVKIDKTKTYNYQTFFTTNKQKFELKIQLRLVKNS